MHAFMRSMGDGWVGIGQTLTNFLLVEKEKNDTVRKVDYIIGTRTAEIGWWNY